MPIPTKKTIFEHKLKGKAIDLSDVVDFGGWQRTLSVLLDTGLLVHHSQRQGIYVVMHPIYFRNFDGSPRTISQGDLFTIDGDACD